MKGTPTLVMITMLSGCYSLTVKTQPQSAVITNEKKETLLQPQSLRMRPLQSHTLAVTARGYRSSTVRVRWRLWGWTRRGQTYEVRLINE